MTPIYFNFFGIYKFLVVELKTLYLESSSEQHYHSLCAIYWEVTHSTPALKTPNISHRSHYCLRCAVLAHPEQDDNSLSSSWPIVSPSHADSPWRLSGRSVPHWGTATAVPPPFRPGNPALCGSHPLVTPYYCRLGDLLCFVFMSCYYMFDLSVYYLFFQYFDTVGWVFFPVKTVSHITYTVLVGT